MLDFFSKFFLGEETSENDMVDNQRAFIKFYDAYDFDGLLQLKMSMQDKEQFFKQCIENHPIDLEHKEVKKAFQAIVVYYPNLLIEDNSYFVKLELSYLQEYFQMFRSDYKVQIQTTGLNRIAWTPGGRYQKSLWEKVWEKFSDKITWDDIKRSEHVLSPNQIIKGPSTLWHLASRRRDSVWEPVYESFKSYMDWELLHARPGYGYDNGATLFFMMSQIPSSLVTIYKEKKDLFTVEHFRHSLKRDTEKKHTVLQNLYGSDIWEDVIESFGHLFLIEDLARHSVNDFNYDLNHMTNEDTQKILEYCRFAQNSDVALKSLNIHKVEPLTELKKVRVELKQMLNSDATSFEPWFAQAKKAEQLGYKYAFYDIGEELERRGGHDEAIKAFARVDKRCAYYEQMNVRCAEELFNRALDGSFNEKVIKIRHFFDFSLKISNEAIRCNNLQRAAQLYYNVECKIPNFGMSRPDILPESIIHAMFATVNSDWCWEAFKEQVRLAIRHKVQDKEIDSLKSQNQALSFQIDLLTEQVRVLTLNDNKNQKQTCETCQVRTLTVSFDKSQKKPINPSSDHTIVSLDKGKKLKQSF